MIDNLLQFHQSLFMLHFFTCFAMTGIIWIIQMIHYPAYHYIELSRFSQYQKFHTTTITFIVGPLMVIEIFTGLFIWLNDPTSIYKSVNLIGLGLIWLATLFFSIPAHQRLLNNPSESTIRYLVRTNWIRTTLWTIRSILLLYALQWPKLFLENMK